MKSCQIELQISDFGFRNSDFGFQISDFGLQISDFGFQNSDFGFRISDFGFRIRILGRGVWGACPPAKSGGLGGGAPQKFILI